MKMKKKQNGEIPSVAEQMCDEPSTSKSFICISNEVEGSQMILIF